jgi:hypothetical protein
MQDLQSTGRKKLYCNPCAMKEGKTHWKSGLSFWVISLTSFCVTVGRDGCCSLANHVRKPWLRPSACNCLRDCLLRVLLCKNCVVLSKTNVFQVRNPRGMIKETIRCTSLQRSS